MKRNWMTTTLLVAGALGSAATGFGQQQYPPRYPQQQPQRQDPYYSGQYPANNPNDQGYYDNQDDDYYPDDSQGVYAPEPPPQPPNYAYYNRPAMPAPGYFWIDGYWNFAGGRYSWCNGYWARPPHAGGYWVRPRYSGGRFFVGFWGGGARRGGSGVSFAYRNNGGGGYVGVAPAFRGNYRSYDRGGRIEGYRQHDRDRGYNYGRGRR
jgi:hypothetical protein